MWLCLTVAAPLVAFAQIDAVATARYDLKLGFPVSGVVAKVNVKPGQRVEAGEVLMELHDEEGQALVELYTLRANSDLEVQSAVAQQKVADVEVKAQQAMFDKSAGSAIELERAKANALVAQLKVDAAKQGLLESSKQLSQASARHQQYTLKAPQTGLIEKVTVSEGEPVKELDPIVQLVVTDPLWIDAAVPTDDTLKLKVGDAAWVRSKLVGHDQPAQGKIIHMAQVADAASETRLVRVEVPNKENLPAGGHVTVTFTDPGVSAAAAK